MTEKTIRPRSRAECTNNLLNKKNLDILSNTNEEVLVVLLKGNPNRLTKIVKWTNPTRVDSFMGKTNCVSVN